MAPCMEQGTTSFQLSGTKRNRARDFVVAPYSRDSAGVLSTTLPKECLRSSATATCDVRAKSYRIRKSGPGFALTVAKCHAHDVSFTIYPPGYAPYQRVPVLSLAADGGVILDEKDKTRSGLSAFEDSVFQAALDARERKGWARSSAGAAARCWSTQRRHLERSLSLTGIAKEIDKRTREQISTVLSVPLLVIREQSQKELAGYQKRGAAVSKVLAAVHRGRSCALRLLLAGHLAGGWGRPHSVNPQTRSLEELPFYVRGTPAPT